MTRSPGGNGGSDPEGLDRFAPVFSAGAQIAGHQLGWRMAVLPFRSVGATVGYRMALGMAEELSTALSRFKSPRLIAPVTFWDGAGPAADFAARCQMYHVDYVVDGTIQVTDSDVRVTITLSDVVLAFEVIWTGHFDGRLNNLASLEDRMAKEIISRLDPDLFESRPPADAPRATTVGAAHHSVLTAIHWVFRLDRPRFERARELLTTAVTLDPDYAAAHAWLAYWSVIAVGLGWAANSQELTSLAGVSAERAVALDPTNARAVAVAGHVKSYLEHDVRAALTLHARAIELNPNMSIAWTLSSWSKLYNGEHTTAIRHAQMAQSLSPRDPHIFFAEHALMTAHLFRRQLEEAETVAEVVLARTPGHASALNGRLAILGHMSRLTEAAECLAALRALDPDVSVTRIIARAPLRPDDKAFYAEGLLRAGVPP